MALRSRFDFPPLLYGKHRQPLIRCIQCHPLDFLSAAVSFCPQRACFGASPPPIASVPIIPCMQLSLRFLVRPSLILCLLRDNHLLAAARIAVLDIHCQLG
jgi:hypothetical protein